LVADNEREEIDEDESPKPNGTDEDRPPELSTIDEDNTADEPSTTTDDTPTETDAEASETEEAEPAELVFISYLPNGTEYGVWHESNIVGKVSKVTQSPAFHNMTRIEALIAVTKYYFLREMIRRNEEQSTDGTKEEEPKEDDFGVDIKAKYLAELLKKWDNNSKAKAGAPSKPVPDDVDGGHDGTNNDAVESVSIQIDRVGAIESRTKDQVKEGESPPDQTPGSLERGRRQVSSGSNSISPPRQSKVVRWKDYMNLDTDPYVRHVYDMYKSYFKVSGNAEVLENPRSLPEVS
jgi:hypothetical protein